eukprot:jgi/Chlat1/3190/Chrsp22S03462
MVRSTALAVLVAAVLLAAAAPAVFAAEAQIDIDVLNFALNLEYLEGEYYSRGVFGHGLSSADKGGGPGASAPDFGGKSPLKKSTYAIMWPIARDELNHVRFLRLALGSAAVPAPEIDLLGAFGAAADAALGTSLSPKFNPYANSWSFFVGAFTFEDVGVQAYKGAAPLIQDKGYLEAAAGILAVEAYHAGAIRALLYNNRWNKIEPYGAYVVDVIQAISDLRDSVNGPADTDRGLLFHNRTYIADLSLADKNSVAYSASTSAVLRIVYLGGEPGVGGGFFPKKLNGNIK